MNRSNRVDDEIFRNDYYPDRVIKLNSKHMRVAVQHMIWNLFDFDKKPPLKKIKISDKRSMLTINGVDILCYDRHHHHTKREEFVYAMYDWLKSVDELLSDIARKRKDKRHKIIIEMDK